MVKYGFCAKFQDIIKALLSSRGGGRIYVFCLVGWD